MQSLTRPNGSVTSYVYDTLNRLTEISNTNSSAEVLNQRVFTYNNWDFRGSETISGSALPSMPSVEEGTKEYDYNAVNQLLGTINPSQTFVYDADGNLTQGFTPLLGGAGGGFPFTAEYDAEDRMKWLGYTDRGGVVHRTEYRYSGDGFLAMIRKFENSSLVDEIRIVRDGLLAVQERDGSNNVLREYTWGLNLGGGIGGLLNLKQGGSQYSYLYDGKGNVAAVLDGAQAVVAAYRYDPFGKLLAKTGSLTQPFGFSTKRYDEQTGLLHYQYRSYAPEIGRWTTRDPLGEAGGMNLYAFVGNNPVNWVDPWGLEICLVGRGDFIIRPLLLSDTKSVRPVPGRLAKFFNRAQKIPGRMRGNLPKPRPLAEPKLPTKSQPPTPGEIIEKIRPFPRLPDEVVPPDNGLLPPIPTDDPDGGSASDDCVPGKSLLDRILDWLTPPKPEPQCIYPYCI